MQVIKLNLVKFYSNFKLTQGVFIIFFIPFIISGVLFYNGELAYTCIRVIDGDTVILKRAHRLIRVRLKFIDAPEVSQYSFDQKPIGLWAKSYLEKKILNKKVHFTVGEKGFYGRDLGEIFYREESINLDLVKRGLAIPFGYEKPFSYRQAQYVAKSRSLGIWGVQGFYNPWKFRKMK